MEAHEQEADWEVYFCHIEEKPAFIGLDLSLGNSAPIEGKTHVVEVSVPLASPGEDGFPAEEEWEPLGELEDALVEALGTTQEAMFVGKTLNSGYRKFYFYAEDSLLHDYHVSQVLASFPAYSAEVDTWEDTGWETYFGFLYPEAEDMQMIQNGRLIRHMQENGDDLTIPRPIDHLLYFKNESARLTFWEEVKENGYEKTAEEYAPEVEETPYMLQVTKVAAVEEDAINEMNLYLWRLAQEHDGAYDGWETTVEGGEE